MLMNDTFYWLRCDAPGCTAASCFDGDGSVSLDPQEAGEYAEEHDWCVAPGVDGRVDGEGAMHYCAAHSAPCAIEDCELRVAKDGALCTDCVITRIADEAAS